MTAPIVAEQRMGAEAVGWYDVTGRSLGPTLPPSIPAGAFVATLRGDVLAAETWHRIVRAVDDAYSAQGQCAREPWPEGR